MQTLIFRIPIAPTGKEEARRSLNGGVYTPRTTRELMKAIAAHVRTSYRGPALDGPIRVLVLAFIRRPKSVSRNAVFAPVKPDQDNVSKLLGDSLQGTLWTNDSRIVDARVLKFYAPVGAEPWVDLLVGEIDERNFRPPTEVGDYLKYMAGESSLRCG